MEEAKGEKRELSIGPASFFSSFKQYVADIHFPVYRSMMVQDDCRVSCSAPTHRAMCYHVDLGGRTLIMVGKKKLFKSPVRGKWSVV